MARVVHAVDVEITGELDPSLAKAVGMTETELKRIQSAAKTFNSLMAKISPEAGRGMDEVARHVEKAESAFSRMGSAAKHHFHEISEAGAKAGESIKKAFEPFHRGFEKLGEFSGITGLLGGIGGAIAAEEFTRGAFETRAEREVLQNQLRSMTESMGKAGLDKQIDMMVRNMEGRETPVRYDELMKTSTLLLGADRKRFGDVESVHKMLGQIADISRSPEAFGLASASITKMVAEGTVDAAHLRELSIDTGFQFREGMAKALKVTPEQMSAMMKKHKFTGTQLLDALFKSIDEATGPGGPAHGHALAQLQGLSGIQERFLGHWKDFQESFGIQLENFLTPITDLVFNLLTPAALTHAFDRLSGFTQAWGAAIGETVRKLDSSGVIDKLKTIGTTIFGGMGTNFDKFFTTGYAPGIGKITEMTGAAREWIDKTSNAMIAGIKRSLDMVQSAVSFIRDNFQTIKGISEAIALTWAGMKLWDFGSKVAEIFKAIGGAVFNVGTATINVAAGVETGAAGKAIATGAAGTASTAGVEGVLTSIPAFWLLGGGIIATELHRRFGILGKTPVEPANVAGLPGAGISGGAARADPNPLFQSSRQIAEAHQKAAEAVNKTTAAANNAAPALNTISGAANSVSPALNNISPAANSAASSLNALSAKIAAWHPPMLPPVAPVVPHAEGGIFTQPHIGLIAERGPEAIIPLKQISAHGPEAIIPLKQITAHASGGIAIQPHVGLIAERGPEAIIPLKKGGGGFGHTINVSAPISINSAVTEGGNLAAILTEHAHTIAREVQRVLEIEFEQRAVV